MHFATQEPFSARFDWGEHGVRLHAARVDALVVVDVLSFTTSVDVATARGALVVPWRWRDASAADAARALSATLAGARGSGGPSLSPASLRALRAEERLLLPSPNGATLATLAGDVPTFAGCLRNATAVARAAAELGPRVAVIAAGERWTDGALRPAWEDLVGAGAILAALPRPRSPEAEAAVAAFEAARPRLAERLRACASGRELLDEGFVEDVDLAAALDASGTAPRLLPLDGTDARAFRALAPP